MDSHNIITAEQDPPPEFTPENDPGVEKVPLPMRANIAAIKDAVGIEDVAQDYGQFKPQGAGRLLGRCVSPAHEDRTPSMTIYTDEQRFKCFGIGCGEHGDVLDLVRLVEGCELHEAIVLLSTRYSIELPGRPDSWHRKQERQRPMRDAIEQERIEHIRLLLFRLIWVPWLKRLPPQVREESEVSAWKDSLRMAGMLYAARMDNGKEEW